MIINERNNRVKGCFGNQRNDDRPHAPPQRKRKDLIEINLITEDIRTLSDAMLDYSGKTGMKFVTRDAENILHAEAIILIGNKRNKTKTQSLNCGYCGFDTCVEKMEHPAIPVRSIRWMSVLLLAQ